MGLRGAQLGLRVWEVCVAHDIFTDIELIQLIVRVQHPYHGSHW